MEFEEGKEYIPSTNDMAILGNWCHYTKSILKAGRVSHFVNAEGDQDPAII